MRISAMLLTLFSAIVIACADSPEPFAPEQVSEIVYRHIYAEATSGKLYSPCKGRIYTSARDLGLGSWEVDIRCREGTDAPLARTYVFNERTGVVVLLRQGTPVVEKTLAAPTATP